MERFRHAMALPPHIQLREPADLTTRWMTRRRRDRAVPASAGSTARTVASGRQRAAWSDCVPRGTACAAPRPDEENSMGALIDKIKGKAKQLEGRLTGNRVLAAQGTAEKAKGDLEGAASRVARQVKRAVRGMTGRAKAALARSDRGTRAR
jgi:uncharacterized protein YjbJ (UPF0337 family)